MSNVGQAALGIVGGVVGFFVGGPTGAIYGFQLGLLAGSALFPTQLPAQQGPRLGDGQQTVSQVGAPIAAFFGTQPVGGIIVWASPIREVANTETAGGKGGPEQDQTTFTYFRSFAVLLASREPDEGPIGGIRKIKANGKPIYDRTLPSGITLADILADPAAAQDIIGSQAATSDWASKMTIYLGTEDQMPDPVIESFEGVGNVPAYRGYAYVVFDDVQMKPEDGNRLPGQWSFQLYEEGDEDSADLGYYASEVLYDWLPGTGNPSDGRNTLTYGGYPGLDLAGVLSAVNAAKPSDSPPYFLLTHGDTGQSEVALQAPDDSDVVSSANQGNSQSNLKFNRYHPGLVYTLDETPGLNCGNAIMGVYAYQGGHWGDGSAHIMFYNTGQQCAAVNTDLFDGCFGCGNPPDVYFSTNITVTVNRAPGAPADPCEAGVSVPGVAGFCVNGGLLYPSVAWELDDTQSFHVLRKFVAGTADTVYPLGPARPIGHVEDTGVFWTAEYLKAVARGDIEAGLVYSTDYPQMEDHAYSLSMGLSAVDTLPVSLASIVARICNRVAARAGRFDYDVSDLESTFVIGYQMSRPMAARGAIETLRSVGFFDIVESGIQLKFVARGKAAVATLTDDDLGAHFEGEETPSLITTRKVQELDLPRQIRVHYQNPAVDFDPGEEHSPERFDTAAESVVDIDLGVACQSDQAAQAAEILFRDFWAARYAHEIQLDVSQSAIEAADNLITPVDGQNVRVRVPSLTERLPNLRTLSLVRDDDGSYVSTAVGSTSLRLPSDIVLYGPVGMELLDLPPLLLTHNDAGIYAAVYPLLTGGAFRGAQITRSTDNGASYTLVGSATAAVTVGTLLQAVPSGPTTTFDEATEILVELEHGTLGNRTEADVLDGANPFAIGVNGRWEVGQFKTRTLVTGNIYRLTGLLRGRRGTEYNLGTSVAGDRFVMLDNVARLPMAVSEVGASRIYKAQPIGSPQQTNSAELTGAGITLKPFSPVHIVGVRDDDDNLVIEWVRRDRLADESAEETTIVMSEDVEDYELDVLDSDGVRRRTISVSEPTVTYTAQQQLDDFGALQPTVDVSVYQISVQVGRGASGSATL